MAYHTMVVYCEGPKDDPHPRRVIARYAQDQVGGWLKQPTVPAIYEDGEWLEMPNPDHGAAIRLPCKDCGYNPKRALDRRYGPEFPPFSRVFDTLTAHGCGEISARNLVAQIWGAR